MASNFFDMITESRNKNRKSEDEQEESIDIFDISILKEQITHNPRDTEKAGETTPKNNSPLVLPDLSESLDGSPNILLQSDRQTLSVPPARTDTQELLIAFKELLRKLSSVENRIQSIENNIFQIENNNNFSDSNLRGFLAQMIKETLEHHLKFLGTPEADKTFLNEDLEDGEVILFTKEAPVKSLTKIDKSGINQLLEDSNEFYISCTLDDLRKQLREVKKTRGSNNKEDVTSRKQRNNISLSSIHFELSTESSTPESSTPAGIQPAVIPENTDNLVIKDEISKPNWSEMIDSEISDTNDSN